LAFYATEISYGKAGMSMIWEDVKERIRLDLPKKSFSLWIEPITPLEESGDTLILGCPNKFSCNWVMERYVDLIKEKLGQVSAAPGKVALKIARPLKVADHGKVPSESRQLILNNVHRGDKARHKCLNLEFTFDRFVVGKSNEFAYSASRALAQGKELPYNHLFLLGKTGLGKSHLSQAIGHEVLKQNGKSRVWYITAENFINELIFALKNNKIDEFKTKYRRACDILILEEVHFLSGKEKTQEELVRTLDILVNDHKKIILTSSLLPKDIPNLSKGLSSRFNSGIITTLDNPDFETRINIINRKASEQNLVLSEDIINLVAKKIKNDVRQIESALRCLKAKSELMKATIDSDLAREILKCLVPSSDSIHIDEVRDLVCKYFKVDPFMLRSKSRKKIYTYPRNVYAFLCRQCTDHTAEEIGRSINRNHSTVLYASEVIGKKMKIDLKIKHQVEFLSGKLKKTSK
jgi:chromosomal replication initiator protein